MRIIFIDTTIFACIVSPINKYFVCRTNEYRILQSIERAGWILIVDDEIDIVSVFKQGLENRGFRVFGFTNPALALEHFQINSKRYGTVISDCRMPGINGYEFIKKVREIRSEARVFLMTAFEINDAEFRAVLPDVRIDGFIQKPISLDDLTHMITERILA